VIFCRNVLIYFDDATKRQVVGRLAATLASDGYLVLGASETTTGISRDFVPPEGQLGVFMLSPEARARKGQVAEDGGFRRRAGSRAQRCPVAPVGFQVGF
jgi:chemotaxis protein methyltransferase CheR